MCTVRFHEHGDPNELRVDDVERPEPSAREVLVEVRGAGVNPVDTYICEGATEPFTLPMIPASTSRDGRRRLRVHDRLRGRRPSVWNR